MRKWLSISLVLLCSAGMVMGQIVSCPDNLIYLDGGPYIRAYDPGQPVSANNPSLLNIPTLGSGLALLPNISGSGPSPTFYSASGGTYHYWNGNVWINTGHALGNSAAINLAGCSNMIFNLVGTTGAVYAYNGTAAGTLVTTIPNFNGAGPYDLAADCNCNFYVLNTNSPNQALTMYNSSGQVQCTYSLQGMPNATSGTGLAIIGNQVFVRNSGFYIGNITGSVINFTSVPTFTAAVGDFASCSSCYSTTPLVGASISGNTLLTCSTPTTNFYVTSPINPVTFSWAGPGIVSGITGSMITLNAPGIYSCTVTNQACNPSQVTLTLAAQSSVVPIAAVITPSGTICSVQNNSVNLSLAQTNNNHTVTWLGPGLTNVSGTNSVNVTASGAYTVRVSDPASGCTAVDVVNVAQRPNVGLSLSSPSICSQNYNGSPNNLTLTASGATSYSFFTSTNAQSIPLSSAIFNVASISSGNTSPLGTGTLIGQTGLCADTITTTFSIVPNPLVVLSSSVVNICPGGNATVLASGATNYTWTGPSGLSSYSLSSVVASPAVSTTYSVMGTSEGCHSMIGSLTLNVKPLPSLSITAAASTICAGSSVVLKHAGTATSFSWYPPHLVSSPNAGTVNAQPVGLTTFTLIGALNGCTSSATSTVQTVNPPVVTTALSQPTMCFSNYNGSPNTVTISANGANTYTLLSSSNGVVAFPNGPFMQLTAAGTPPTSPAVIQTTLLATTGVCTVAKMQGIVVIPNPVLTITPQSINICPGETKTFVASGADHYTWLPPVTYTLSSPNTIIASPKSTSFYAVYGSSAGCQSMTKNATAMVLPIPEVSSVPVTSTICAGTAITLSVTGTAASYNWYPSTSLNKSTGISVVATPMATQQYTIIGTLNTCTNMAVTTVSAIPMPSIQLTASSATICRGTPVSLYAQGAMSYKWFPSSILNTPIGAAVIGHPLQNTTFTVQGFNGVCTGSASILINSVKPPDMTISAAQNKICSGSKLQLQVKGAQSYTWVPVSSLTFNGTDSIVWVSPKAGTNYTVYGAAKIGTVECYQQLSYYVSVVPQIVPFVTGNTNICKGDKTTLYASGGNTYEWSPPAGINITNGSGVVASPSVSTIYSVNVSHDTYCGVTTTVAVNVSEIPGVFAGNDTSFNRSEAIVIRATGNGTLRWITGEGIACADCPETRIFPQNNSCYVVEVVNEQGCRAQDEVCVKLTEEFSMYIPNSFSPNNDGLNDVFLIFGEHITDVSIQVFNRWGTRIFASEEVTSGWDGTFNGQPCKPDVYTYVLKYTGLDRKHYSKTGSITLIR